MARRDQRITVAVHAKNYGHIATYNEGLDWARSDYLLLLSADDVLAPGSLRRAVEVMEAHPDVGLTYGKVIRLTGAEKPVLPHATPDRFSYALTDGPRFLEAFCASPTNSVETATAVVRTSVQKRVGGYRPELPHAGDLEMWLRFAAVG
jgi:glycosyltransferase involved in cell wall biosynthesis